MHSNRPCLRGDVLDHHIEGIREGSQLIVGAYGDAMFAVTRRDPLGGLGEGQ